MSRKVLVLEEVLGMLQAVGASRSLVEKFRAQAEAVIDRKSERELDEVTVASGFGAQSGKGHVDFTLNDERSQMEPAKAREIGLMLIEAAEAAMSDEMFVTLLQRVGLDAAGQGRLLLQLREIRQGTRGTSWPS